MFEWIFGNSSSENARQLYVALCSLELEEFKKKLLHICRTQGSNGILWDFTDPNKRTLLHIAVMTGDLDTVAHLIGNSYRAPIDINAQDDRGFTALHYAVMIHKNQYIVKRLVTKRIDVNILSNHGNTAFDIVEGFWQEECKRLFQDRKINKKFLKTFLKKVDIWLNENTPDDEIQKFFQNPTAHKFIIDHPFIVEMLNNKLMLETTWSPMMQCVQRSIKNGIDIITCLKPRFVHFEQERSGVYWYEVPKASADESWKSEILVQQGKDTIWNESTLGLSKLYEEAETIPVNDTASEQTSMATNSQSELQRTLNREEIDLTEENLNALGSFSLSEKRASVINRFFSDATTTTNSDDQLSEYSFVSTSANTDGWDIAYQHRMH